MTTLKLSLISILIALAANGCDTTNPTADASIDAPLNAADATPNSDATLGEVDAGELCCNPAAEPGFGNNNTCFEGASCCDDGTWQCNNGAGQPTCTAGLGEVCAEPCCEPSAEPGVGDNPQCFEGASCCDDGTWQCNNGAGQPGCNAGLGDVCI